MAGNRTSRRRRGKEQQLESQNEISSEGYFYTGHWLLGTLIYSSQLI